jgi:hypothetical protein
MILDTNNHVPASTPGSSAPNNLAESCRQNAGGAGFFDLPAEMRNMIYNYTFADQTFEPQCGRLPHGACRPEPQHSLALLLVNRQIRTEALTLAYSTVTFVFSHGNSFVQFLDDLTPAQGGAIQHIRLKILLWTKPVYTRFFTGDELELRCKMFNQAIGFEGPRNWTWLQRFRAELPNVQRVELVVFGEVLPDGAKSVASPVKKVIALIRTWVPWRVQINARNRTIDEHNGESDEESDADDDVDEDDENVV